MTASQATITLFSGVIFCALSATARNKTLKITSIPSDATVEINGLIVGKTPYTAHYPSGYFHKTHTIFGARLEHALVARISMEGYATQQLNLAEGPFSWRSFGGRSDGNYWLIKTHYFEVILEPLAKHSQAVRRSSQHRTRLSPRRASMPLEQIVEETDPAIVRISGGSGFFIASMGLIATNAALFKESRFGELVDVAFVGDAPSLFHLTVGMHWDSGSGQTTRERNLYVLKDSDITISPHSNSACRASSRSSSAVHVTLSGST